MKTSDVDILIIPGWTDAGPEHWQTRWVRGLKTARRIEQADWDTPQLNDWVANITAAVAAASRPVVLVAHSCGVTAVAHAAASLPPGKVAGAFLVAAPHLDGSDIWPAVHGGFARVPMTELPFPSMLIASSTDPYCSIDQARVFAAAWRSTLIEAGDAGHLNTASGHGPWPDGALRFGLFLKQLSAGAPGRQEGRDDATVNQSLNKGLN
jgi:uncharacterized protein